MDDHDSFVLNWDLFDHGREISLFIFRYMVMVSIHRDMDIVKVFIIHDRDSVACNVFTQHSNHRDY